MRPRIKICCIGSVEEAVVAVRCGADALGLVARMPSGPGPIDDELIATVAGTVPPPVATFLLTSETEPDAVVDHVRRCGTSVVQLVDRVGSAVHRAVRAALPAVKVVQVVHVEGPASVDEAIAVAAGVDALLLDSGRPGAAVRELGGTGRVHDWSLSRRIVAASPVPVFLAGGLGPANVAEAAEVGAFGLDMCSGVRTDGRLDEAKVAAVMAALGRSAT